MLNNRPKLNLSNPFVHGPSGNVTGQSIQWINSLSDLISHGPVLEDTRANRLNALSVTPYYGPGQFANYLFYETDTTLFYLSVLVSSVWTWIWVSGGPYQRTQSQLAALAATLGTNDTGLLVFVTDYAHMLQWTGSAWQRGPGDLEHSDSFHWFGSAPTDTGWHICDGSTVNYLLYTGSTASRTLPNISGSGAYPKAETAYAPTILPAQTPTFNGTLGTTGNDSASQTVQSGAGVTVAAHPHNHSYTPAGSVSLAGGDPVANFGLLLYYRQ